MRELHGKGVSQAFGIARAEVLGTKQKDALMDIEQLKLILDMVGAAGDGAKDLALLWFALAFTKSLLGPAVGTFALIAAYRLAVFGIRSCSLSGQLAKELETWLPLTNSERLSCIEAVRVWKIANPSP